jgi:RimJ/RimL family protein N-acetyltransferase
MPSDRTLVRLRDVEADDLEAFFRHQMDPESVAMAAFPPRDLAAFTRHWAAILANPSREVQAILANERCVGYVTAWEQSGRHLVGYWIDRSEWGRGIATQALALFITVTKARPLHALVAESNTGSIRVLEKAGFRNVDGPSAQPVIGDDGVGEFLFVLTG